MTYSIRDEIARATEAYLATFGINVPESLLKHDPLRYRFTYHTPCGAVGISGWPTALQSHIADCEDCQRIVAQEEADDYAPDWNGTGSIDGHGPRDDAERAAEPSRGGDRQNG